MASDLDRDPYEHAAARGCYVKLPAENELFVDIDSEEDWETFVKTYERLNKGARGLGWTYTKTPSPSGEPFHLHIVVTLPGPVSEGIRIGLQALLGSDRMRETLSWLRHMRGEVPPTVFFEKPGEGQAVKNGVLMYGPNIRFDDVPKEVSLSEYLDAAKDEDDYRDVSWRPEHALNGEAPRQCRCRATVGAQHFAGCPQYPDIKVATEACTCIAPSRGLPHTKDCPRYSAQEWVAHAMRQNVRQCTCTAPAGRQHSPGCPWYPNPVVAWADRVTEKELEAMPMLDFDAFMRAVEGK